MRRSQWESTWLSNLATSLALQGLTVEEMICGSKRQGLLRWTSVSTVAILLMLFEMVHSSARRVALTTKSRAAKIITECCHYAVQYIAARPGLNVAVDFLMVVLRVGSNGVVYGWREVIEHMKLEREWDKRMAEPLLGATLASSFDAPQLRDVLLFGLMVHSGQAFRCDWAANRKRRDTIVEGSLKLLRYCLAPMLERNIIEIYPFFHRTNGPPPAMRFRRPGVKAKACQLDADTAWAILSRAKTQHIQNVRLLLECKNDEEAFDSLGPSNGYEWQKQEFLMYVEKQQDIFKGYKQICTVADPSCHAGDETLVGIVWSWEANHACLGPVKLLAPALEINPDEISCAPGVRMQNDAGTLTRKKAYRQMQGVFCLQNDVTGNTMDAYKVPEGNYLQSFSL